MYNNDIFYLRQQVEWLKYSISQPAFSLCLFVFLAGLVFKIGEQASKQDFC